MSRPRTALSHKTLIPLILPYVSPTSSNLLVCYTAQFPNSFWHQDNIAMPPSAAFFATRDQSGESSDMSLEPLPDPSRMRPISTNLALRPAQSFSSNVNQPPVSPFLSAIPRSERSVITGDQLPSWRGTEVDLTEGRVIDVSCNVSRAESESLRIDRTAKIWEDRMRMAETFGGAMASIPGVASAIIDLNKGTANVQYRELAPVQTSGMPTDGLTKDDRRLFTALCKSNAEARRLSGMTRSGWDRHQEEIRNSRLTGAETRSGKVLADDPKHYGGVRKGSNTWHSSTYGNRYVNGVPTGPKGWDHSATSCERTPDAPQERRTRADEPQALPMKLTDPLAGRDLVESVDGSDWETARRNASEVKFEYDIDQTPFRHRLAEYVRVTGRQELAMADAARQQLAAGLRSNDGTGERTIRVNLPPSGDLAPWAQRLPYHGNRVQSRHDDQNSVRTAQSRVEDGDLMSFSDPMEVIY